MTITKRDGRTEIFNEQKIKSAITSAFVSSPIELDASVVADIDRITHNVTQEVFDSDKQEISVEDIQDIVEKKLMESNYKNVAKKYILYRDMRTRARKNTIDDIAKGIVNANDEFYLSENANKNPRISSTMRDYLAGAVSRDISDRYMLPKDIVEADRLGIIHYHDKDYNIQPMHNCFTGETKFITSDGIRRFMDYKDGDEVIVKDKDGIMRCATVHRYEPQKMQVVMLKSGKREQSFVCTSNHRWVLSDGTVTTSLKVGNQLYPTKSSVNYEIISKEDAEAFCIGFAVGDGCDRQHKGSTSECTIVRLCGEKVKYANYFKMAGYTLHNVKNSNDIVAYIRGARKQDFLNARAWRFMTSEKRALAFKGYYAADGATNANKISTTDERVMKFIEDTSGIAGYYISSMTEEIRDTNYKKDSHLYTYHFVIKTPINLLWRVKEIKPYRCGQLVPTWCVEEPKTHTFTLEGGVVTGNCDLINLDDMLQNGTVISETLIEKPHSFSVACTVTSQIIAQVASSQYGGQSFSLESLAPFVDISRQKIRNEVIDEYEDATLSNEQISKIVEKRLKKEISAGIQTIQYQLVTIQSTNGQSPFVTIFMYLNEARNATVKKDLALLIEEVLRQRIKGIKNEDGVYIAPAFPKLIYVLEDDNAYEGSEYFYLTELAVECSSKRLVPDYISEKIMKELKGDVYAVMG